MTLAAMKKKETQKLLLQKRRKEIIKTIGVKQRKHGLQNLIQPEELKVMMKGVKNLNDLSKFVRGEFNQSANQLGGRHHRLHIEEVQRDKKWRPP